MKKIFISLLIISLSSVIFAQHFPKMSQYELNKNLINPAAITSEDINVNLLYRNQWTGFKDSPNTFGINAYKKHKNMGFGLFLLNDNAGVFNQNIFHLNYSYALKVADDIFLQFGLSGGFNIYKVRFEDLEMYHANDPYIPLQNGSAFLPDFNFGVLLSNIEEETQWAFGSLAQDDPTFYVGVSMQHIVSVITTNPIAKKDDYLSRHFNLMGGFKHVVGEQFQMEETLLLKYVAGAPFQADLGFRFFYQNNYWTGLSYRSSNDISVKLGVIYQYLLFGYSYDFNISKIPNHHSHEIVLGFRMQGAKFVPKY